MGEELFTIIGTVLCVGMLTEMFLYFGGPDVYSFFARIPFGATRRVNVMLRAREALRKQVVEGSAGYRDSAVGRIDLGRLELPLQLEIDGLVLHFRMARGFAVARLPYSFATRIYGMVRVDIVATGDNAALELRPRFVMLGWPSFIGLAPIAVGAVVATTRVSKWTEAFLLGALFVGINVVIGLIAGRSKLEAGVVEIERQIQAALLAAENDV